MTKFVYMIIATFVLACLSCGDSGTGPAANTWAVSGTLTCSLAADGIPAYVAIMTDTTSMTLLYLTTAVPFAGGESSYSFSNVAEGSYYLGACVDMNSNADPSNPEPDDGDLIALLDLVVNGDEVLNVSEDDWSVSTVSGDIEILER